MKVSHEAPVPYMRQVRGLIDYDYCLPHLLDENEMYKAHFLKAKKDGRYIIMDNSLHELGKAYDFDRLIYWVNELEPDEFMVPDVWMKCAETAAQAKYWKQFEFPEKTQKIAVIQGEDKNQAYLCANLLYDLGYKKLCVSYGATWYNDFFPHNNPDMGKPVVFDTITYKPQSTILEESQQLKFALTLE